MIDKTLAHYKVLEQIGQGGMGTVYRARDTKLDRDVALKFLPQDFAFDPERVARFEREAKTLASLNHANIASIYGFEEDGEQRFLAMELVEGEDLSERLSQGALPRNDALDIARQMADGLEEAHERGIVHRDLKPANVRITHDGKVKILDFGLARAYEGRNVSESDVSESPTITAMTQVGVILGTAAYMSPEQAKGKPVDRRADLWAFGVILWEMLTGNRLFDGEDASDTLAAVLRKETPWDELPTDTPKQVRRLLERCLERDPRKRLRDIGETRIRLEEWTRDPSSLIAKAKPLEASGGSPVWRRALPWGVAAIGILAAAFFALQRAPDSPVESASLQRLTMDIRLPHESALSANAGVNIQLSPDGTRLAYRTTDGVRVRALDQRDGELLRGTKDALQFTFSPDGKWIAFLANGKLLRVSITGGAPSPICDAQLVSRGIAWVNAETIVFAPNFIGGLQAVSLKTGEVRDLTTADTAQGERSHRWPTPLPDGRSVLFLCQFDTQDYDEGDVRMVSLDGEPTTIYRGGAAPRYVVSGHLLFVKDNSVFAVPFDPTSRTTSGLAVPVINNVWARVNDQENDDGSAQYDISPRGMLVYRTLGASGSKRITRVDLQTGSATPIGDPGEVPGMRLSPDGKTLALVRTEDGDSGIYFMDIETGLLTRITFGGQVEMIGAFSRDSKTFYYSRGPGDGSNEIYSRPRDGSTPEQKLFETPTRCVPTDVSPDGNLLLLSFWNPDTWWDTGVMNLGNPGSELQDVVVGHGTQADAKFSPDGKWLVHVDSGGSQWHIFLRRVPDDGSQWLIHKTSDRLTMAWLEDGSGLMVRGGGGLVRVPVNLTTGSPRIGAPMPIPVDWELPAVDVGRTTAFAPDGSVAYLSDVDPSVSNEDRVVLVTDWFPELERLAPRDPR